MENGKWTRLTPENLGKKGFEIQNIIPHSEFNSFMSEQVWKSTKLKLAYVLVILFFTGILAYEFSTSYASIIVRFLIIGLGIFFGLLILPIHEGIHYLTYKRLGAEKVTITPFVRQGYILTRADQFIVGKGEMKWIALLPFIIISTVGLLLLAILDAHWQIFVSAMILFHTSMCQADFRMLDHFVSNAFNLVMFDDIQEGVTYIYYQTDSKPIFTD